jgi:hypothetical protein
MQLWVKQTTQESLMPKILQLVHENNTSQQGFVYMIEN